LIEETKRLNPHLKYINDRLNVTKELKIQNESHTLSNIVKNSLNLNLNIDQNKNINNQEPSSQMNYPVLLYDQKNQRNIGINA